MKQFNQFNIPSFLQESLRRRNISTPTPIQEQSIPVALSGKDIIASAKTGTGKTLAYLLPVLSRLTEKPGCAALILAPTRELAAQVHQEVTHLYGKGPNAPKSVLIIGGESMEQQIIQLRRKPSVIIGTPGRVTDHLNRRTLSLHNVEYLVLDETDRMLDMGMREDLDIIVAKLSAQRQTLLFSATLSPTIIKLAQKYLKDPEHIAIGTSSQPSQTIEQDSRKVNNSEKFEFLLQELQQREGSVIVFVKTKVGADQLSDRLRQQHHLSNALHGDLRQRRRDQVIRGFRAGKIRILVATDVAARGLDIEHVKHVINFDIPLCPEDYIHRIGRTGRAGKQGYAMSFIAPEENRAWQAIRRLMDQDSYPTESIRSVAAKKAPFKKRKGFFKKKSRKIVGKALKKQG